LKGHFRAVFLDDRLQGFLCSAKLLFPHQPRHYGRQGAKFDLPIGERPVEPSPLYGCGLREKIRHWQENLASPAKARIERKPLRSSGDGDCIRNVSHLLLPDSCGHIRVAEVRMVVVDDVDFFDQF